MAKTREEQFPVGDRNGTFQVPERVIPDSATFFYYEFVRCNDLDNTLWSDPESMLEVEFEGSLDGGQTWIPAGAFRAFGGITRTRFGQSIPVTSITVPLPPGASRRIRGTARVTKGPIRTAGAIEFRDKRND
jgi:hypothetical protein